MDTEILRRRLRGTVISAFEPAFAADADSLIWNGRKPARREKLIVRAACAEDVQEAVRFAAGNGLTVSPRGGGHHFSGLAARADMVIDLRALDGLRLDAEARTARVEPAVTNARMAAALDRHDLAFPVGHCGSVPMSGYLLGGGFGWNSAEWGFACFSVAAVEVVLADGEKVTATAAENPDIFWAARGAGPDFFGIVIAYHLRLQPARRAISTAIRVYPASSVCQIANWAESVMATAPANVEFTAKVDPGPDGPVIAVLATVFAATDAEAAAVHARLAMGAPDALEVIGPMPTPFAALYEATAACVPEGRRYAVDTLWSDARFGDVLAPIVQNMALAPSPASAALVVLRPNAVPTPTDAAFSRSGRIFGVVYGIWQAEADDAVNTAWLRAAIDSVSPICTGAYVGEADLERPDRRLPVLSPEAQSRLSDLHARFDPQALFGRRGQVTAIAAE